MPFLPQTEDTIRQILECIAPGEFDREIDTFTHHTLTTKRRNLLPSLTAGGFPTVRGWVLDALVTRYGPASADDRQQGGVAEVVNDIADMLMFISSSTTDEVKRLR